MNDYFFSILPLWGVYMFFVLIIVLAIRGGIAYAKRRKKYLLEEDKSTLNTLVGATLGLLAFMLAFTFSISLSRFEDKKHFLLEEVNSIETSWLRSGLVENPYNDKLKQALVAYTKIRIYYVENQDKVLEVLKKSEEIQNEIWALITEMTVDSIGDKRINALLIESVNEMFDNQTKRVSIGLNQSIPTLIWIALFSLIIIAMFEVGYLLGKEEKINWLLVLALSISFSAIIIVIIDLDSSRGNISINNQTLFDMYDRIKIE